MHPIAHATDLSGDDEPAFLHACALAAASRAPLATVYGKTTAAETPRLPEASAVALRWGLAIHQERICHECCDDVADTVIDAIRRLEPQLVVTGTHARHGLAALLNGSVGETIARNVNAPTLIVHNERRGFIDPATGAIELRRVLVPAGSADEARHGIAAARRFLQLAGVSGAAIEVIHATTTDHDLDLSMLDVPVTQTRGRLEDVVVDAAHDRAASLIVMISRGHDGVLDVLRGSHTEHVIRAAGCPVLSVPMA